MAEVFDVVARLKGDASGFKSEMASARDEAQGLWDRLGGGAGTAGAAVASGLAVVTAAAAATVAGLYMVGGVFDDVSDTIRAGTGASGEALAALEADAMAVGRNVPAAFSDIGPVVADLNTRMGLTGETLQRVAGQYLEAGRVLGQAVDVNTTTGAFNAFQIAAEDVEGAMDSLFRASQSSGVGMNELASSAARQAPAMQALGFSFEETIGLMGGLDRAGLNTQAILGGMSRGLVEMAKSGEEPADAFQRIMGEMEGLIESGDRAAAIDLASGIFGTRGATQFLGAVESGAMSVDSLRAMVEGTGDTIMGVGAATSDFAEGFQILKNRALAALEPMGTAIYGLAGEAMFALLDSLEGAGDAFAPFLSFAQTIGDAFMGAFDGVGASFGPLIGQFADLAQSVSPLSIVLQALAPVLPMIASALGGVAAVLMDALGMALQTVLPIITQLSDILVGVLGSALMAIVPTIAILAGQIGDVLAVALTTAAPLLAMLGEFLGQVLVAVMPLIDALLLMLDPIMGVVQAIVPLVGALLPPLITLLTGALEPVLGLATGLIDFLMPGLLLIVEGITTLLTWIAMGVSWLANLATGTGDAGAQMMAVFGAVGDFIGEVWSNIVSFFEQAGAQIASWFQGFGQMVASAWDAVVSFIQAGVTQAVAVFQTIVGFFSDIWSNVSTAFSTGVDNAIQFVRDLPGMAMDALGNLGNLLVDSGAALIQGFIDGISSMLGAVGDAVGGVMDFVGGFFPNSPAEHGPLSGAGWVAIKDAAGAIEDQFAHGFTGKIDNVMTDVLPNSRVNVSAAIADSNVASGGGVTVNIDLHVDATALGDDDVETLAETLMEKIRFALEGVTG